MNWLNVSNPVALWWFFLISASFVNIVAWSWSKYYLCNQNSFKEFKLFNLSPKNLIWFSGFYVFGCAYRSIFPKADVQKICLFDTWLSSVFLGRSVATIAELAFVAQWAIVIEFLSKQVNDDFTKTISKFILPLIFIAECFSWYAVITTNYLGNMIEESLWTLTYSIILIAQLRLLPKFKDAFKYAIAISVFSNFIYILFMIFVDVHMYYLRWREDLVTNKVHFGFFEGLIALNTKWFVTYDINAWRSEIPWMSLYFSVAVLVSIALCYVPLKTEKSF